MATVVKRGNSYKITVSVGYDSNNKQIRQHMTWTPDPGMTKRQVEKELERQKVLFEERCKTEMVNGGNIKLSEFLDVWFRDYAEKTLKPRTVDGYRYLSQRVTKALGHVRLEKLQPRHLLSFYDNLEEDGIREDIRYASVTDLGEILKERRETRTTLAKIAGLGTSTVDSAVRGKNVSASTAKKISTALDIPQKDLFAPVARQGLSGKTRLHYHRFLSSVLETAVQWQYIPSNPCDRVKAPKVERHETSYLDEEQAVRLIEALENEPEQYQTMILLLLNTGLRRGELCGLEWRDVDLDAGTLSVRRNVVYLAGRGITEGTPKTNSSARTIKMPDSCIPLLKRHRAWQAEKRLSVGDQWEDTGKIFTTWNGRTIHPDTLTGWFADFVKRQGLPHITIHGLRHTNATLLIAAGTNLRTVSGRLGHAQASTTANIYAHAIQSADAAAAETLGEILAPRSDRQSK